jgi:hypothetical protein
VKSEILEWRNGQTIVFVSLKLWETTTDWRKCIKYSTRCVHTHASSCNFLDKYLNDFHPHNLIRYTHLARRQNRFHRLWNFSIEMLQHARMAENGKQENLHSCSDFLCTLSRSHWVIFPYFHETSCNDSRLWSDARWCVKMKLIFWFWLTIFTSFFHISWQITMSDWLLVASGLFQGLIAIFVAYYGNKIHRTGWLGGVWKLLHKHSNLILQLFILSSQCFMLQSVMCLFVIIPTLVHQ